MVKKIVGWSIHDSLERAGPIRVPFCPRQAKIVFDALEMARISCRPGAGLLHHSDRGSQYASNAFQTAGLQQEPEAHLVCVLDGFNP